MRPIFQGSELYRPIWAAWAKALFEPVALGLKLEPTDGRRLRKVRDGSRWPDPTTLWWAASVARHAKYRWCAGPLLLFVAGRFGAFIEVMATVAVPADRIMKMLETATLAASPLIGVPFVDKSHLPKFLTSNPASARKAYRRHERREAALQMRDEYEPWILSSKEEAAFDAAFFRPKPAQATPDIAIACFMGEAYEFGVDVQREYVLAYLKKFITSKTKPSRLPQSRSANAPRIRGTGR